MTGLAISTDPEEARREASPVAARRAKDAEYHPEFFLPPELESLRADTLRVARHYDVQRHVDPEAPHNRLVTDALVDAFTLAGTPNQCLSKLRAMQKAGAMRVALFPAGRDRRGAMRIFVRAVLPRLQEAPSQRPLGGCPEVVPPSPLRENLSGRAFVFVRNSDNRSLSAPNSRV